MKALRYQDLFFFFRDHRTWAGKQPLIERPDRPFEGTMVFDTMADDANTSSLAKSSKALGYPIGTSFWPTQAQTPTAAPTGEARGAPEKLDNIPGAAFGPIPGIVRVKSLPAAFDDTIEAESSAVRDVNLRASQVFAPVEINDQKFDPFAPSAVKPPTKSRGTVSRNRPTKLDPGSTLQRDTPHKATYELNVERHVGTLYSSPLPSKHPVAWLAGTERASQNLVGFGGFSNVLYSDHNSKAANALLFSTRLADLTGENAEPDPERTATLAHAMRVFQSLGSTPGQPLAAVAFAGGLVPNNPFAGRGAFTEDGFVPPAGFSFARGQAFGKPRCVFYATVSGGGVLSGGNGPADKHRAGSADGVAFVAGHLDLAGPWFYSADGVTADAPPEHGGIFEAFEIDAGITTKVRLVYDPEGQHIGLGPNFSQQAHQGLHKWQGKSLLYVPPERPPYPPQITIINVFIINNFWGFFGFGFGLGGGDITGPGFGPGGEGLGFGPRPEGPGPGTRPRHPENLPRTNELGGVLPEATPCGELIPAPWMPGGFIPTAGVCGAWPPGGVTVLPPAGGWDPCEPLEYGATGFGGIPTPGGVITPGGTWVPVDPATGEFIPTPVNPRDPTAPLWDPRTGRLVDPLNPNIDLGPCLERAPGYGLAEPVYNDQAVVNNDRYARSWMPLSAQAMLFTPQPIEGAVGSDLWITKSPDPCDVQILDYLPPSASLVAFGTQLERGLQDPYTMAEPTVWRNGYTPGGIVVMPPNVFIDDRAPDTYETVVTNFTLYNTGDGENTFLAFGEPKQTGVSAGLVVDGMALGLNSDGALAFYCLSEVGVRTEVAALNCSGEFSGLSYVVGQHEPEGGDADDFTAVIGETSYVDTTAIVEVTLPATTGLAGQRITIKDAQGNANNNNITVTPDGSDTIDGASSLTIELAWQSVTLEANGAGEWYIV